MQPSLSVIIPTFNRRRFICDAVKSVLDQCHSDLEVIVVDDGSTDDTRAVLEPYMHSIRYLYQVNAGVSAARNRGVKESRGRLVAFLDSDDLWAPSKLSSQLSRVSSRPVVSFAGVEWFVDRDDERELLRQCESVRWPRYTEDGLIFDPVLDVAEGCYLHLGTLVCSKEVFLQIGFFDESLCMGEDEDWFSRASFLFPFDYVPQPLLRRRFHAKQIDSASEASARSLIMVFDKMVHRTVSVHPAAHRASRRRLAAKWSHLANILQNLERHREAVNAARTAFLLEPTNLKRLAKVVLFSF